MTKDLSDGQLMNQLPGKWRRQGSSTRLVGAVFGAAGGMKTDSGEGIYQMPQQKIPASDAYVKEKVRSSLPAGASMSMTFLGKIQQ
jgi:hypothetical protein